MRAFIAIELPAEIKELLSKIQNRIMRAEADVKWVLPKNIHLTLKFLGEIDGQQQENISKVLREITCQNEPFATAITSLGAFPKLEHPRVIWVGLDGTDEPIKRIANTLEGALEKLNFPKEERAFSSHITLGRVRSGKNRNSLVKAMTEEQKMLIPLKGQKELRFPVRKITLFKSTLSPRGPVYEAVCESDLKTT